jgi:prolyl-tRNA synthetase
LSLQTHEEAITDFVASLPQLTHKQLPLKLYQITSKFRDEIKPRFGLLRGREFTMKDLYTFDKTVEAAHETYDLICTAYNRIFQRLNVPFVKGIINLIFQLIFVNISKDTLIYSCWIHRKYWRFVLP